MNGNNENRQVKYALVAVEKTAYRFDKLFSYSVPDRLSDGLMPGCRVLVPFGGGGHGRQGMVFGLTDTPGGDITPQQIKPVAALIDRALASDAARHAQLEASEGGDE